MKSESWVEKYRPVTLSGVVGNVSAIADLKEWAQSWRDDKPISKAIIVHGPPGIGKCVRGNTLILTDRGIIKIEDIVNKKIDFGNRNVDHGQTGLYDSLYDSLYDDDDNDVNEILKEEDDNIKNVNNVISISPKLNYDKYKIIDKYDMGENDVITIRTRLGLEISGTLEHRIIIIDRNGKLRFKKLQDISTLDQIIISYNTNIFNNRLKLNFCYRKKQNDSNSYILQNIEYMNEDIAKLLGYVISEGVDCAQMTITNYDREVQNDIVEICKKIGIDYVCFVCEDGKNDGLTVDTQINSIAFVDFMYYLGYRHGAENKEIPWSILQAGKDSQISFIRALFDVDGTVHIGDDGENILVEYNSSSYELCRQLQIMLLNFGIIGRLSSKKGAKLEYRGEIGEYEESDITAKAVYRLIILGGEILKFAEIINFCLSRKKEILDRCVGILEIKDRLTDVTYPNIEKIVSKLYEELKTLGQKGKMIKRWQEDFEIGNKTIKLNRRKAIGCEEYLQRDARSMSELVSGKRNPSIYMLRRILSIMSPVNYLPEYRYLEVLSNQFIFDNVVMVANERTKVYDVTIDDVHSYIGNSMINHNTASGHALAQDMGWEILELNASDQRTKKRIHKDMDNSTQRGTIEGSKRLIILDEADNFHKMKDKGGEDAVVELISNTRQPVMLIANEFYDMPYGLRAICKAIKFGHIWTSSIMEILRKIAKAEGITCDKGVIEKLTENSNGDLRAAINDLQAIGEGISNIKLEDIITGKRDNEEDNIFKVLAQIFRGESAKDSHNATLGTDKDPEHLINWIDENIPIEYTRPQELSDAYGYISKAGWFLAQVRKRQNYEMWKYASVLMTSGVFVARHGSMHSIRYRKPQIGDKLWQTKAMRTIRDSLAKKIAVRCHTPIGFARNDLFPFFKSTMRNDSYAIYITASLYLSPEELAFIFDGNIETKRVQEIYAKAQAVIREDDEYGIVLRTDKEEETEKIKDASKWGRAQMTIDDAWGV